jgi:putative ABC transport system permease protein
VRRETDCPRLVAVLIDALVPRTIADDLRGDLTERLHRDGRPRWRATLSLVRLVLSVAWHARRDRWRSSARAGARLASLVQDVTFTARLALRHPGRFAAAVLTLALGIGAATALFSVVQAWILQPLPFRDPDRLVMVWETVPSASIFENTPAPVVLAEWRARAQSFEALAPLTLRTVNLTGDGDPERLSAVVASPGLFDVLGVAPALGRQFVADDGRAPAPPVVMLSHDFWQRRFGGAPDVVGRSIALDGQPFQIVGVLAPGTRVLQLPGDVWLPLAFSADEAQSGNRYLWVVGRLRAGVTVDAASAEVDRIALERSDDGTGGRAVGLHAQTLGTTRDDVLVLFGASGLVLLLACANVGSLTLAAMLGRRQELVARSALGASRARLMRQIVVEQLGIGACGALAGLVLARLAIDAFAAMAPPSRPADDIRVFDATVFAFTAAAGMTAALLVSLVPAWHAGRTSTAEVLRAGARTVAGGPQRWLKTLVVVEIALALALVISVGLALRSLTALGRVDLGFRASGLVFFDLPPAASRTADANVAFFEAIERRLSDAGLAPIALSQALPLRTVGAMGGGFAIAGAPADRGSLLAYWRVVNPSYFDTLGQPLVAGRAFDRTDRDGAPRVAIVTESFARRAWPDEPAIGRRIGWGSLEMPFVVVGVAPDVRQSRASAAGAHVYMPYLQVPDRPPSQLAVRAESPADQARAIETVRRIVRAIDPAQPVARVTTSDALLWTATSWRRLHLTLLAAFAGLSLILGAVGVYGVLAFLVTGRRAEIGVRLALGATPASIRWLWLRQAAGLAALGIGVGLAGGVWIGRLMEARLFQTSARDPLTFGAAIAVLLVTAAAASIRPALRATRVDPIQTLRQG